MAALIVLLIPTLAVPQQSVDQIPPDIAKISTNPSCVSTSTYAEVLDAKEKRTYTRITVTSVGTAKYRDDRTPFRVTVSIHEAEVTADNVREETMSLGTKDCVRWTMMVSRVIEEYYKEHPPTRKAKK